MRYLWLDEYLMAKPAVTKDFKKEWNWIRYFIGGKMFAAVLLNTDGKPYYINLKLNLLKEIYYASSMRTLCQDTTPINNIGIQSNQTVLCQMIY